jgi:hypothetical protein
MGHSFERSAFSYQQSAKELVRLTHHKAARETRPTAAVSGGHCLIIKQQQFIYGGQCPPYTILSK